MHVTRPPHSGWISTKPPSAAHIAAKSSSVMPGSLTVDVMTGASVTLHAASPSKIAASRSEPSRGAVSVATVESVAVSSGVESVSAVSGDEESDGAPESNDAPESGTPISEPLPCDASTVVPASTGFGVVALDPQETENASSPPSAAERRPALAAREESSFIDAQRTVRDACALVEWIARVGVQRIRGKMKAIRVMEIDTMRLRRNRRAPCHVESRMLERTLPLCFVFVVAALGCSSSSSGGGGSGSGDVSAFCQKAVSCGQKDSTGQPITQSACEAQFQGWIPPSTCVGAVQSASCADLNSPTPPQALKDACFPTCTTIGAATCSGDQTRITDCQSLGNFTFDCSAVCTRAGKTYTGSCGTTYGGQTSSTGQPVCWCK